MPTSPLERILARELSVAFAREQIEVASPLLKEIINYATNALMRCQTSAPSEDYLAIFLLFRHLIEMSDGVEVLLSQSCATPSLPLVRSIFEAMLSVEYILETDCVRRGRTWLYFDLLEQLEYCMLFDTSTLSGKRFQDLRSKDPLLTRTQLVTAAQVQPFRAKIELKLSNPEFQIIDAEYQATKNNRKRKQWFQLFGGPHNLRELASHLGHEGMYELLYGQWSHIAHAKDASRFRAEVEFGEVKVKRLRTRTDFVAVTMFTATMLASLTRQILAKLHPGEEESVKNWYLADVQARLMNMPSSEFTEFEQPES